jgi:hypothetical protein
LQENFTVNVLIGGIGVRKMDTNISQGKCPQHGITNGVQQHIRIAMSFGTFMMGYFHTPDPKIPFLYHLVKIDSKANPERHVVFFINV